LSNSPVGSVGIVDMSKKQQKYEEEVRAKKLYYLEDRERKWQNAAHSKA